jgi:hypothetical protein
VRTPKRLAGAAVLLALLPFGVGCGEDDPTEPTGSPTSPSTSTTTSPTDGPTSGPPTTGPDSTVAPATGPELRLKHASAHLPKGWTTRDSSYAGQQSGQHPETLSYILLTDDEYIGPDPVDLDWLARTARKSAGGKILQQTTLSGSPAYHLAGKEGSITDFEEFGTVHEDRHITLEFQFRVDFPPEQRAEVIESVMASLTYK